MIPRGRQVLEVAAPRFAVAARHLPSLLLVLAVAAILRLPQVTDSVWLDEQHTAWTIREGIEPIPARARMGNNSPFYFYLPWLTTRIFGWNEVALRLPSLLAGLALPVAIYGVSFRWCRDRTTSFAAAFIAVIDPNFLYYSIEARPYAILQLLSVLQLAAFAEWILLSRSWSRSLTWGLVTVTMFHLHFTSLFLPAAQVIVLLLLLGLRWIPVNVAKSSEPPVPYRRHYPWRQMLVVLALVALACVLPYAQLRELFGRRYAWNAFVRMPSPGDIISVFPIVGSCTVPLVLALLWRVVARRKGRPAESSRPPAVELLFVMVAVFSVGLFVPWLLSRWEIAPLFYRRYLLALSTIPCLFVAGVANTIQDQRWRRATAAIACFTALFWIGPISQWHRNGQFIRRSQEDWRETVAFLQKVTPHPVLLSSGLIESDQLHSDERRRDREFANYCSLPLLGLYKLSEWEPTITPLPRSRPWEYWKRHFEKRPSEYVWLVVRGKSLRTKDSKEEWEVVERQAFGSVTVTLLHRASRAL